eukprot:7377221-Prymnesium_polylepis.2
MPVAYLPGADGKWVEQVPMVVWHEAHHEMCSPDFNGHTVPVSVDRVDRVQHSIRPAMRLDELIERRPPLAQVELFAGCPTACHVSEGGVDERFVHCSDPHVHHIGQIARHERREAKPLVHGARIGPRAAMRDPLRLFVVQQAEHRLGAGGMQLHQPVPVLGEGRGVAFAQVHPRPRDRQAKRAYAQLLQSLQVLVKTVPHVAGAPCGLLRRRLLLEQRQAGLVEPTLHLIGGR